MNAIRSRNLPLLACLVNRHPPLVRISHPFYGSKGELGRFQTLLHWEVEEDQVEMVELLLHNEKKYSDRDFFAKTEWGDLEPAYKQKGGNFGTDWSSTPLFCARSTEIVELILSYGFEIDIDRDPLHMKARSAAGFFGGGRMRPPMNYNGEFGDDKEISGLALKLR